MILTVAAAAVGIGWWAAQSTNEEADPTWSAPTIGVEADPESGAFGAITLRHVPAAVMRRLGQADLSTDEWQERLSLHSAPALPLDSVPAVLGEYTVAEHAIVFRPRFRLATDLQYTIHVDVGTLYGNAPAGTHVADSTFSVLSVPLEPRTLVTAVFPSTNVLPMNQLRMYVHFSAPMSVGQAYNHIRLVDVDTGEEVPDPFVIVEEELWDPAGQRFTLLFDPGRIKRGLRPHEEAGLPLREGRSYRLVIDGAWLDARGAPLMESFAKPFGVVGSDRESPDHATWHISPPKVATTDGLRVSFPESLDYGLLHSTVQVRADGVPLSGRVVVSDAEREWTFVPDEPWTAGEYVLAVDTDLEDLAGNNLRRLFDRNLATDTAGPLHDVNVVEKLFVVAGG